MKYLCLLIFLITLLLVTGCVTVYQNPPIQSTPQVVYVTVPQSQMWVHSETLQIPARGMTGPDYKTSPIYSLPLENGVQYKIQVNGVYSYGNSVPWGIADAEWSNRNGNAVPGQSTGSWFKGDTIEPWLDLMVNEKDADWGNFQPDHLYTKYITGEGQPISFRIKDSGGLAGGEGSYDDNSGYLTVDIYYRSDGNK